MEVMRCFKNLVATFFLLSVFSLPAMGQKQYLDLQIQSVNIKPAVAGKKTFCRILVKNGSSVAFNSVGVKISARPNVFDNQEFSCGQFQTGSSPLALNQRVYSIVQPGQTVNVDFYLIFKKPGTFTIKVTLPDSISWDANQANNTKQISVNVVLPRPVICSISPGKVKPGEWIEIRGSWFTVLPGLPAPVVKIGPYSAEVDSVTPTAFLAKIPCKKLIGAQSVSVTTFSGRSNTGKKVYVNSPKPTIKSVDPKKLLRGKRLKITVTGLISECQTFVKLSGSILRVNRTNYLPKSGPDGTGEIFVTVPNHFGAGPHKLMVQTVGGQDTKAVNIKP